MSIQYRYSLWSHGCALGGLELAAPEGQRFAETRAAITALALEVRDASGTAVPVQEVIIRDVSADVWTAVITDAMYGSHESTGEPRSYMATLALRA